MCAGQVGCTKSERLEPGDNILGTIYVYLQPLWHLAYKAIEFGENNAK